MSRALQLASKGRYTTHPNPRVGCVLVRDNHIVGEGWHQRAGGPHAEINALAQAGTLARGADCYISLEPCSHIGKTSPCTDALLKAGIRRVIVSRIDPNPLVAGKGIEQLRAAGIIVESGLLESQASQINRGFEKRMTRNLPLVRCKLAMSLDARTALADGTSQWITDAAARMDVQRLRAESSAVMTGIDTVLHDDPRLGVRDIDCQGCQPIRVVLDRQLRTPSEARILSEPGEVIIFTLQEKNTKGQFSEFERVDVVQLSSADDFLPQALHYLACEKEVNEILLESGATLAGAMMAAGLIDELVIYMAPTLLGHESQHLLNLPGISRMTDRIELEYRDIRMVGKDCRIILVIKERAGR